MCSYLASFPAALAHAFIARYSRPGDVVLDPFSGRGTTPLQACAEGRIGVGNDLNPFAHLLTAAKVEPPTRAEASTRLAALRLAWNADSAAWLALATRVIADPQATPRPGGADPGPPPMTVGSPSRRRSPSRSIRARSPSSCSCATTLRLDDRTDRFLAAAITGILHGKSASYLSELMPNTFSMAPRYVRDFAARTGLRLAPSATCSTASRQSSIGCSASRRPPPRASPCSATRATSRTRPGPRCAHAGAAGPRPARRHLAALPARREVRLLQLAAHVVPGLRRRGPSTRRLDDAHHREPYLAFLRDVPRRPAPDPDRRRGRRARHRRRRDRPRAGASTAASASPSGPWSRPPSPEGYRLAGVALDDVARRTAR